MKRLAGILALLALLAACGQAAEEPEGPDNYEDPDNYKALIAATPVAQVEGETVSPDGRFEVRSEGASGLYASGVQPPEFLRIIDRETGEVLWQDRGWLWQSALWSEDSGMVALAWSARTWNAITVIETENWTSWDFTLPDGSPIPEYTYLPYDEPWGTWQSDGYLDLTIGRGGDAGEKKYYACSLNTRDGKLEGTVHETTRERLPGSRDFDHDGEPDIVELVKDHDSNGASSAVWQYRLWVRTKDNGLFWDQSFHTAHPGWGSVFACRMDGEDYLLRYNPTMYQGFAAYTYQLFSLTGTGEENVVRDGKVEFDINFGSPMHESYDPEAIAAFLEEVHGLLEGSLLLVTTENGEFRSSRSGTDFQDDLVWWTQDPLYDESKSLEENIRAMGDYWEEHMAAG